jgi:hypothetical protein
MNETNGSSTNDSTGEKETSWHIATQGRYSIRLECQAGHDHSDEYGGNGEKGAKTDNESNQN